MAILGDKDMIKAMKKFAVDPVKHNDLDSLTLTSTMTETTVVETISSNELNNFLFEPVSRESKLSDEFGKGYYQVIAPNLDPEKQLKWEFRYNQAKVFATMQDMEFWNKLKNGEIVIAVHDIYNCETLTKSCIKAGELKNELFITKVVEVINNQKQDRLFG
jgi:hypothetical protein